MSLSAKKRISFPALFASLLTAGCVNADSAVENQEYGFKVSIPDDFPVCMSDSATHIHGVGTVLIGRDCSNPEHAPSIHIWADYNVVFVESALENLRGNPVCSGSLADWAEGEWSEAIGGLKTAMCRVEHSDGNIDIVLAAQAGEWPEGFDENAPYINHTVYFNSTKSRLDDDMQVFRAFLRSIEITEVTFSP